MPNVNFKQTMPVREGCPVTAEDVSKWLKTVPPMARVVIEESAITVRWNGAVDDD